MAQETAPCFWCEEDTIVELSVVKKGRVWCCHACYTDTLDDEKDKGITTLREQVDQYQQHEDEIICALGSLGILPSGIVEKITTLRARVKALERKLTECPVMEGLTLDEMVDYLPHSARLELTDLRGRVSELEEAAKPVLIEFGRAIPSPKHWAAVEVLRLTLRGVATP